MQTAFNIDQVHDSFAKGWRMAFPSRNDLTGVSRLDPQEVSLWTSNQDRERFENLATLYGIIQTLDHLERAYVRDTIRSEACVDAD
jgi:hypothetical protein